MTTTSVVGRAVRGALAGAVGVLAMDLVWFRRYRSSGGEDGFMEWERSTSTESFEEASAPGRMGQVATDVIGVDLPDEQAGLTTDVVHWLTGMAYGSLHGVLLSPRGALVGGLGTGLAAFLNSYATLGAIGIYDPIWHYDAETLGQDLSAHLVFGLATGVTYRLLQGPVSRGA